MADEREPMRTWDHYVGRRDDLRGFAEALAAAEAAEDHDNADELQEELDTWPLSFETITTHRIVLGTGGPHDEVRIDVQDGVVTGGEYRYLWRGMPGHGVELLGRDEAQEWADAFGLLDR